MSIDHGGWSLLYVYFIWLKNILYSNSRMEGKRFQPRASL